MRNIPHRVLFLDDERDRFIKFVSDNAQPGWRVDWTNNSNDCFEYIKICYYDEVYLDHDLMIEDGKLIAADVALSRLGTGMQVVDSLIEMTKNKKAQEENEKWHRINWYDLMRITKFIVHSTNDEQAKIMYDKLVHAGFKKVEIREWKD